MQNKLSICKSTREIAADTLFTVLTNLLSSDNPISELDLANAWLLELRKHKEIFKDGWYSPPPHGIGVLFSSENNIDRTNYKSLRPSQNWPQKDVFLNRENGIAYLFASPVNKQTGIIGDFGLTIYFGKNKKIIDHLITTYKLNKEIFYHTEINTKFAEITNYASKLCKEKKLINTIESSTDPTGTNIGHTIPSTDKNWPIQEKELLKNTTWEEVCKTISSRRIFLNNTEQTVLTEGMGITIEPRPQSTIDNEIPMVSFHTIGLFYKNGEKELLTNFDEIFKLANMNYLL